MLSQEALKKDDQFFNRKIIISSCSINLINCRLIVIHQVQHALLFLSLSRVLVHVRSYNKQMNCLRLYKRLLTNACMVKQTEPGFMAGRQSGRQNLGEV